MFDPALAFVKTHKQQTLGAFLGLLTGGILVFCYDSPFLGAAFCLLFCLIGFLHIPITNPLGRFALNGGWGCVCILLSCMIPNLMVEEGCFFDLNKYKIVTNLLCAAVVYGFFLVMIGRIKPAVLTASGLLLLLCTVDGFVFRFRGSEFLPSDLFATQTALNVVGQYSLWPRESMFIAWCLWLLAMFVLWALPSDRITLRRIWLRLAALIATVICMVGIGIGSRKVTVESWSHKGTVRNGYFLNFYVGIRDTAIQEPEDYSADTIAQLEQDYQEAEVPTGDLPDILVIMNESYADFRRVGDLRTNISVTPFADSLHENTIRGFALASIFGAKTANSEFEFLTGASMSYLPKGSVPYQMYIKDDTFSLARVLSSYGYDTATTHPYLSSGWSRTVAYPLLGFSESTFEDSYPYENLIREYISDREMYEFLLNRLDDQGEAPLFLFGISMQNHGGYTYEGDNYTQTVFLEGYEEEYSEAELYLTLLHESDCAMEYLLTALQKRERKTVVLFFGDHFPSVEAGFYEELNGGPLDTLESQMKEYMVPFFIWANYDIPEQEVEITSLNYLSRYLLEAAELPLSPYHEFLKDLEEEIPAINVLGYYSKSQGGYIPLSDARDEEAAWLSRYAKLQYNHLADAKNKSELFFKSYLQ